MLWERLEDSRLVKAWESQSDKNSAKSTMALAPQKTFWIVAKAGYIPVPFNTQFPPESLAESVAEKIIRDDETHLSFDQMADAMEAFWHAAPQEVREVLGEAEIILVQNKIKGLGEAEKLTARPRALEPTQ